MHRVRNPRGPRVTGEAREELKANIAAMYADGKSVREIAAAVGKSYGFVHQMLEAGGVQFGPRGGANRGNMRSS